MCRGDTHGDDRRCMCCDPAARRGARRDGQLRERGYRGDIDPDYVCGTVDGRSGMARTHREGTHDPSPTVRAARARSGSLTPDEEDLLSKDDRPRVRAALATSRRCSAETLDGLADDEDRTVRAAVARHPRTSPEALAHMAANLDRRRDIAVAQGIARHPNTPRSALEAWLENGTGGQRAIARHALAARVAGAVLSGTERVGEGIEAVTDASAGDLDEVLGLEPTHSAGGARRPAKVG